MLIEQRDVNDSVLPVKTIAFGAYFTLFLIQQDKILAALKIPNSGSQI